MNVLIVGSGGREHAIACKVAESKRSGKISYQKNTGIYDIISKRVH